MPHVGVNLAPGRVDSPYGAGDSSGNHKIGQSAGANRLVYRLVPQRTATLWDIWIETRCRSGPDCSPQLADADAAETNSYSAGNPNNWLWEVRFHPMKNDGSGWFDPATNLVPAQQFNPYFQRRNTCFQVNGVHTDSGLKIPVGVAGLAVTAGTPIAMTIAPVNGAPATDYASANQLYLGNGREGAMGRNEVGTHATDAYYGTDPRDILGGASADGSSQWYPGNNFNTAPFTKALPVFIMVYSDATVHGQPYFSAASGSAPTLAATQYTTNYKPLVAQTFTHIRAIFSNADSFQAILAVNGVDQGTVTLTCGSSSPPGTTVTAKLPAPVSVISSDAVTVRFTCNVQNAVIRCYTNNLFAVCLGQGASYYASLSGDTSKVMPVMPVPWTFPMLISGTTFPTTGAPATPAGFTATGAPSIVNLAWTANGESYLDHYNVYRNGSLLGTATTNSYGDSTGTNGVSASYQVSAVALDGRESALTGAQAATPTVPATIAAVLLKGSMTAITAATITQPILVTGNVAAGDKLVVIGGGRGSTALLSSVADTQGNSYVVSSQFQNAGPNATVAIAIGTIVTPLTNADTVTLTWSNALGASRMGYLFEFSGLTNVTDQTTNGTAGSASTTLSVGPTGATIQASELAVGAFLSNAGDTTYSGSSGYTAFGPLLKTSGATGGDKQLAAVYKILAATGAQTATATVDVASGWIATMSTIKGA